MIDYQSIFLPLSVALGLSLAVERVLEFAKALLLVPGTGARRAVPRDAHTALQRVENTLKAAQSRHVAEEKAAALMGRGMPKSPAERQALARAAANAEWGEDFRPGTVLLEPATDPRDEDVLKVLALQLLGFAIGIVGAHAADLRLFAAITGNDALPRAIDFLLTGLLVGGGSKPMHVLVRFVVDRKRIIGGATETPQKTAPQARTNVTEAPAPSTRAPADPLEVPYDGGVDCERLQSIHVRPGNPDLIVYHHTAMHSDSRFADVVRVIKSRTDDEGNPWITGYHCVVTADGGINPFCRWDRYGNHAAGKNARSLGIAFNGNFETNPRSHDGNATGRFGLRRPSEAQLRAGARVVALWTLLYDIPLDFDEHIVPHHHFNKDKACPGSEFPQGEFKSWVTFYREQWEKSAEAQVALSAFKRKPYLFV